MDDLENVHKKYNEFNLVLMEQRDILTQPDNNELVKQFDEFNNCFPVVLHHAAHKEACTDSSLFTDFSSLILERSQKSTAEMQMSKREMFFKSIRELNADTLIDLATECSNSPFCFKSIVPFLPRSIPLSIEHPKKIRKLKKDNDVYKTNEPVAIDDLTESSLNKLSHLSNQMYEELIQIKRISLKEFVFDKNSFFKTIEKMFNISVLLKESLIKIEKCEGQYFVVLNSNENSSQAEFVHFPFTITFEQWKEMM